MLTRAALGLRRLVPAARAAAALAKLGDQLCRDRLATAW